MQYARIRPTSPQQEQFNNNLHLARTGSCVRASGPKTSLPVNPNKQYTLLSLTADFSLLR